MIIVRYFRETKQHTYHNPTIHKSVLVHCNYIGYTQPNVFTGIKSITTLDGKTTNDKNLPISYPVILMSQFCSLFTLISIVSLLTGVIFFVKYFSNNLFYAVLSLIVGLLINIVIFIIANYTEQLFLNVIPRKNGWSRAYIDDYGTISIVDEKSGKTIPFTMEVDGKKRISMMTQKEFDQMYNAFFEKGGFFDKKKS